MALRPRSTTWIAAAAVMTDHVQEQEHDRDKYNNLKGKIHKRRWRLALTAICFTRALVSLSKKALETNARVLRSLSYVTIDVQPNDDHNNPVDHIQPTEEAILFLDVDRQILSTMVREKNSGTLTQLGGITQLAALLRTNPKDGITGTEADVLNRKTIFGSNTYPKPPLKTFFSFVLESFKDLTIIILLICAILSLVFGIKQRGWSCGWYDGGSIIFAILLVVIVSSLSNFKQSKQFQKLSAKSSDIKIDVVRAGRRQPVSIFEVCVGDIVCLKIGDQIPADGLFLDGHSLKVDESSMTGESEHIEANINSPFMLSGTKVTDGFGIMMVTSVGPATLWGEMMSSISREIDEQTPLQARLNKITSYIGKVGLTIAILVLAVLMIRYFTGNTKNFRGQREFNGSKTKFNDVMNSVVDMVAAAVTIVVVAIPEGLPLAVTLTLAFSMKKMMGDNAMVRKLSACETMGSATTICTDKTGTLTLNEMQVTEFWLGKERITKEVNLSNATSFVLNLLQDTVGLNTSGNVYKPASTLVPEVSGSPTEKAILSWAIFELDMDIDEVKKRNEIIQVETFNSEKKRSAVLTKRKSDETGLLQTHWKGAAEMILSMCSSYYDISGNITSMDDAERRQISTIISNMAAKSLRCIAFAHKKVDHKLEESDLTWLGLVGLKDPCRPGVRAAVESCQAAGVNVKMITGDNVLTAKAIAIECGILNPDEDLDEEAIVEGVQFRNFSPKERAEKVEKIKVMARSSPFDKLEMVQCLKQRGHVVAVTGDGTNDAPALKEADIGLSMGIQGTEVAKESSDIVILDDNFASVVTVLRWGRCVYNNIQKFIQFQLTVNVSALIINFIAAISSGKVPLTAVQLLWVNLIMDTLGALALATDQPTNDLMAKPPVGRSDPLISMIMWRNLIAQALYQVIILLTLEFKGRSIFNVGEKVKNTIIFNTFVFCQIFNEFNARKLEKKNVFEGLTKNKLFIGIIGITVVFQLVMVEFLKKFADTKRLDWGQWGACIGIAALSWPIGWIVKCIPVSSKYSFGTKK